MANQSAAPAIEAVDHDQVDIEDDPRSRFSNVKAFYSHPWTQIVLISLICFCCPGVSMLAPVQLRHTNGETDVQCTRRLRRQRPGKLFYCCR